MPSVSWRAIRAADKARRRRSSSATSRRRNAVSGVEGRQEAVGISDAVHYDSRVRTSVIALILMSVSHFSVAAEAEWETVEEVLAVVGSTPILLSDLELATLVRLVDGEPDEPEDTYRSRLLDARIRLEIEFRDIEDGGLLFRLELDPQRARETLIERGGGADRLDRESVERGLVAADLDELVLRVAAVDAFVQQRLRPRISVNMDEIEAAYQQLLVDEIATSDEAVPPLAAVRDRLFQLLVERKLNDEIERWLERAMERQEILRFSR